jgi:RND family efflux transporter MFP subunit
MSDEKMADTHRLDAGLTETNMSEVKAPKIEMPNTGRTRFRRGRLGRKHIVIALAFAVVALLAWRVALLAVRQHAGASQQYARPAVAVEVEGVRYEPLQELLQLTGTVYPLYRYTVAPKVSGRIVRINKRIGDRVSRGETIARIDDGEYQQAVLSAQADLKIAEANLAEAESQLELSEKDLDRVRTMHEKGIASLAEREVATAEYGSMDARVKLAQAQIDQKQAALASAQIRLGYTVLSATEPGFIGERFVDEGTLVAPNSAVASVVGIDKVIVRTTVIEQVYGRLQVGQPAEIQTDAFPGKVFSGTVSRIAPMLDENSRVAQMEVEIPNDALALKPGMFCRANVALSSKDAAQVVPARAVVTRNGSSGVFVIKAGESIARYVPVQLGITTADKAEIVSPPIDGMVVCLGQHLLQDSSAVILPASQATREAPKGANKDR